MPNTKTEIKYVRNRKYGTVSIASNGWTKEVSNVTWNDKKPKLDIREWDSSYNKMSKGLTFSKDEAKRLLKILASIDFEEFDYSGGNLSVQVKNGVFQQHDNQFVDRIESQAIPIAEENGEDSYEENKMIAVEEGTAECEGEIEEEKEYIFTEEITGEGTY